MALGLAWRGAAGEAVARDGVVGCLIVVLGGLGVKNPGRRFGRVAPCALPRRG
jgi:hypothetical protein